MKGPAYPTTHDVSQSRAYFLAFRSADRAVTDVPHYNPTSARSGTSETG
jgi:hypothetical protein